MIVYPMYLVDVDCWVFTGQRQLTGEVTTVGVYRLKMYVHNLDTDTSIDFNLVKMFNNLEYIAKRDTPFFLHLVFGVILVWSNALPYVCSLGMAQFPNTLEIDQMGSSWNTET